MTPDGRRAWVAQRFRKGLLSYRAALNVQGRFDDEIERDPMAALLLSGDELLAVEQGLWGLIDLLCSKKPEKIRIDTDHFYFTVEPLLHRMESARELADRARQRLSGARH